MCEIAGQGLFGSLRHYSNHNNRPEGEVDSAVLAGAPEVINAVAETGRFREPGKAKIPLRER